MSAPLAGEHCDLFAKTLRQTTDGVTRRPRDRAPASEAALEKEKKSAIEVAAETPRQLFLVGMEPRRRALPSDLAASALFVPWTSRQGVRPIVEDLVLVSQSNVKITFSGRRFDEGAADVVMALVLEHQLRRVLVGDWLEIHAKQLLVRVGRECATGAQGAGGSDYKWLLQQMKDLRRASLTLETFVDGKRADDAGIIGIGNLLREMIYDKRGGVYRLQLHPQFAALHAGNRFSLIDWEIRAALPTDDQLPRALQRFISTTSDRVYRREVAWLKDAFGRSATRNNDFVGALQVAAEKLVAVGFLRARDDAAWVQPSVRTGEPMFVCSRLRRCRSVDSHVHEP